MKTTNLLAVISVAILGAGEARAQGGAPERQPRVRDGLMIGFGVGGGNISAECANESADICNEVLESGSANFHVGSMLRPRLGVIFDLWPMVHREDRLTITHVIATGAVRYWLMPRLWLQGGVGGASARFEYDPIPPFTNQVVETDTVLGVMGAVGYEVLLKGDFALDVQLRGGTGFYEDEETKGHSFALQAGFTWF